ncbi:MAG TPA: hypothetical protein VK447_05985 [Myxococcaceae bacterium]|nr:hypothetical protein [Myxococcaceae bacterium]
MKFDRPDTDCLVIEFQAPGNPLVEGDAGLDPFFDVLEAHAGEWMPEKVTGARWRTYSRAAVLKGMRDWALKTSHPSATLYRASPFVEMNVRIHDQPWPTRFKVHAAIYPLSLAETPGRAERWSRALVDIVRAWSSSYPATLAYVHAGEDSTLARWEYNPTEGPELAPRERLPSIYWLNVLGKAWVDALGRERVLSTPAHLLEELPNGAVLLVTRPTVADWRSDEGRLAQARALVHLRPELDFDTVLRGLRERSDLFEPVEPRFEPDSAPLLIRVANHRGHSERPRKIAELNAYRPPDVDEWLPANAALPPDVPEPTAAIHQYRELADLLAVMLHPDVEDVLEASPEALTEIDYRLWWERFPELYEREKLDHKLFPSVGAYLGELLVRHLGGRWVPRRNLLESQVIVGDRAWLPFLRTQRYLQSTQALLDHSLTRFYRTAARHHSARKD